MVTISELSNDAATLEEEAGKEEIKKMCWYLR